MTTAIANLKIAILLLASLCLYACGVREEVEVDIPAGMASQTLKEFAKQTQVEIIFNAVDIKGIRTKAVAGRMAPEEAIKSMLSGTALSVERDGQSGAFAVTHVERPRMAVN